MKVAFELKRAIPVFSRTAPIVPARPPLSPEEA
jgi:hypothetical protein